MRELRRSAKPLALLALLVIISEVLIPWMIASLMSGGMMKIVGSQRVDVKAQKSPGLFMLAGKFSKINVDAFNAKIGKVVFSEVKTTLRDVDIDMGELLGDKRLQFKSLGTTDLVAQIRQEELAKVVNDNINGVRNTKVTMTPEGVHIVSQLAIGPFKADISLEGRIISDGNNIKLVTQKLALQNTQIGNLGGLTKEITLVEVQQLPFGVKLRQVVMDNGKVLLYADNRNNK